MRKYIYILSLFVALLVSACSAAIPEPGDADWCYTYDFTTSLYGATVSTGVWSPGVGVQSVSGDFNLSLTHTQNVAPFHVTADVLIDSVGDVSFSATGNVFGIDLNYADTLPDYIEEATLSQPAQFAGTNGTTASLTFSSNADLVTIENLTIYGDGINPFPSNNCGGGDTPTPTPQEIFTDTPTPTPTATDTPTATATDTPDGMSDDWCYYFDFAITDGGFTATYPGAGNASGGLWSPGVGWQATGYEGTGVYENLDYTGLNIELPWYTENETIVERAEVDLTYNYEGGSVRYVEMGVLAPSNHIIRIANVVRGDGRMLHTQNTSESRTGTAGLYFDIALQIASGDEGGDATLHSLRVEGTGENPFGVTNCDMTPTPTATPSITVTPSLTEGCIFLDSSFNFGEQFWVLSEDVSAAPGALLAVDGSTLEQTVGVAAGRYRMTISTSVYDPGASVDDGTVGFDYAITGATELTGSFADEPEDTYGDFFNFVAFTEDVVLEEGNNTFTFTTNLDSVSELQILTICLTQLERENPGETTPEVTPEVTAEITPEVTEEAPGGGGGGGTNPGGEYGSCGDVIPPPGSWTDIGGWLSWLWKHLIQFFDCTLIPLIESIITAITDFFYWIVLVLLGFMNWSFHVIDWLFSLAHNLVLMFLELLYGGFMAINTGYQIIESIIETVNLFMSVAQMYLDMLIYTVQQLITAWNTAPYTPPPGVPDCIYNATAHDLCAFHWTIEHTLLSGDVGSLIVPALIVLVDLVVVMLVIDMIRKLINRVSETLND